MPHVEQDQLTLPEHLRSPLVFWWGSCCLFFSFLCCVVCAVCLSFSFLAMALSVCFRLMSLTVPLVSFVPLLLSQVDNPGRVGRDFLSFWVSVLFSFVLVFGFQTFFIWASLVSLVWTWCTSGVLNF